MTLPTDPTQLRDRLAEAAALRLNGPASDGRGWYRDDGQRTECYAQADAVLGVVQAELDRLQASREKWSLKWVEQGHVITDLRCELADAEAELDRLRMDLAAYDLHCDGLPRRAVRDLPDIDQHQET